MTRLAEQKFQLRLHSAIGLLVAAAPQLQRCSRLQWLRQSLCIQTVSLCLCAA